MKILVTGGAGFIGSHLVEELLSNENEILIFDNCLTGKKENLDIRGNFKFINDDFGSESSLEEIEKFDPEICFHLAAQSSVVISVEDPALDFEHNILQPIKLIQVLLKSNCKKLVFTSSAQSNLKFISQGEVNIGISYLSDAILSSKVKIISYIDNKKFNYDKPTYWAAKINRGNKNNDFNFLQWLESQKSQQILKNYGFETIYSEEND